MPLLFFSLSSPLPHHLFVKSSTFVSSFVCPFVLSPFASKNTLFLPQLLSISHPLIICRSHYLNLYHISCSSCPVSPVLLFSLQSIRKTRSSFPHFSLYLRANDYLPFASYLCFTCYLFKMFLFFPVSPFLHSLCYLLFSDSLSLS